MFVTKKAEYAISVLTDLARRGANGYVASREIAHAQKIPVNLIAQLVSALGKAGLVEAARGPSGGIRLLADPARVSLRQVIELVDGPVGITRCMVREGFCENQPRCPLRGVWATAQSRMLEVLDETTIADLVRAAGVLAAEGEEAR